MAKPAATGPAGAGSLVVLLRYLEDKVRQRLQPLLDEAGLSQEHWRILALLHEQPGIGMSAIARGAVLPSASATRHVDKLVERGMVVRRIDTTDKRRVVTALSPHGLAVAERLLAEEHAVEADLTAVLGEERFQMLARDLSKLPHVLD
ncbi:MAG TPA: MarR family transcriptional regulator [Nocardioidaceae bacterium]|nr:MarR family transcriptional regulator [Nocardioidaceae bacterium]